ncbi:MAG: CsiV family protein [Halorhodospira sp.]
MSRRAALVWQLAAAAAALAALLPAAAQADTEAGAESSGWYEVEAIVFRQGEQDERHAERWPTRADEPYYPAWQVPAGCGGEAAGEDGDRPPLRCLGAGQRQLAPHWRALVRSEAYDPLYHLAWVQPALSREASVAVPVPYHWRPPNEAAATGQAPQPPRYRPPVYGLLRVYKERHIHAVADLRVHRRAVDPDAGAEALVRAPLHRLVQGRRMGSGELHYLDHPAIGVLIVVRSVSDPRDD